MLLGPTFSRSRFGALALVIAAVSMMSAAVSMMSAGTMMTAMSAVTAVVARRAAVPTVASVALAVTAMTLGTGNPSVVAPATVMGHVPVMVAMMSPGCVGLASMMAVAVMFRALAMTAAAVVSVAARMMLARLNLARIVGPHQAATQKRERQDTEPGPTLPQERRAHAQTPHQIPR